MTRLCPPLTPEEAADLQRCCIRLICERAMRSWPVRPTLLLSPDDSEAEFRKFLGPYMRMVPQGEGDLGYRMARAAGAVLDQGEGSVIIMGSDSPTMPRKSLEDAIDALQNSEAVLGDCEDGGFYLLGLRRTDDEMFNNIDWGGDQVALQTRDRLSACGFSVSEIARWYDIDRFDDIMKALGDIQSGGNSDDYELRCMLETILEKAGERVPGVKT